LLKHGAQVDQAGGARGRTALMGPAFNGLTRIAERLLEAGADPDATNNEGQTALMFAALFGRSAIVDVLIARGADRCLADAAGNSAVSVAVSQANELRAMRLTARLIRRYKQAVARKWVTIMLLLVFRGEACRATGSRRGMRARRRGSRRRGCHQPPGGG